MENQKNPTESVQKQQLHDMLWKILRKFVKNMRKRLHARIGILLAYLKTFLNLIKNRKKNNRSLEIGPGQFPLSGFETLDIEADINVDYRWDASKRLPFKDNTFDVIYASHILEHVPWYQSEKVLTEWVRILKRGGVLEVLVPNGLRICKALVDYEIHGENYIDEDGWYRFNVEKDPCVWAAGRLYTYGDGTGIRDHPNWHLALFTPRYLKVVMTNSGLHEVKQMEPNEVRGYDHGWINLGMKGLKK